MGTLHFHKHQNESLTFCWLSVIFRTLGDGEGVVIPLCKDAVSIFNSPSQLGCEVGVVWFYLAVNKPIANKIKEFFLNRWIFWLHKIFLKWVSWLTVVESDLKAPFLIATTPRCRRGQYSFPWIAPLTLDQYLIMLSAKQGCIKYRFLNLWYDSTRDWTPVSLTIGKHSNHFANEPVYTLNKLD